MQRALTRVTGYRRAYGEVLEVGEAEWHVDGSGRRATRGTDRHVARVLVEVLRWEHLERRGG